MVQNDLGFYYTLPFGLGQNNSSNASTAAFWLSGITYMYVPAVRTGEACRSCA